MTTKTDLTGQKFGRLTVIEITVERKWNKTTYNCKCDCGNLTTATSTYLRSGNKRSCGCLHREIVAETMRKAKTTHGARRGGKQTPEYRTWRSMNSRCYNPNYGAYPNYGAKGIEVCERWRTSFENFLEDMGRRPPGTSIDRIDGTGHYTPQNCRWATAREQQNNLKSNVVLTFNGRSQTMAEWNRELGFRKGVVANRIRAGWPVERALTEPLHVHKSRPKRDKEDRRGLRQSKHVRSRSRKSKTRYRRVGTGQPRV